MMRRRASPAGVLAMVALGGVAAGCSTTRGSGQRGFDDLSRAEIVRCRFDEARTPLTHGAVDGLAGTYSLYMTGDETSAELAVGELTLAPADGAPSGDLGAAPTLTGASTIDASSVGAMVPGDAASTDREAPGVGLYAFGDPATGELIAVVRFGAEANRRDRQRFDGAHTTLRVSSVADERFGGTWTAAEGANEAGGDFCAVRTFAR